MSLLRKLKKKYVKADPKMPWHPEDTLLEGLTFQELIDTVHANEGNEERLNEAAVKRTFNEILSTNLEDARHELQAKMKDILDQLRPEWK